MSNLSIDQLNIKSKFSNHRISQLRPTKEVKEIAIGLIDDFLDEMDLESQNG